jgi:protein-glutamine gamma-glutamyltransferase
MIRQRTVRAFTRVSRVASARAAGGHEPVADQHGLRGRWGVVAPGLVLWFEALLMQSDTESHSLLAPAAAVVGTVGLFAHWPLLARKAWFRSLLAALGALFLLRLVVVTPQTVERGFVAIPRALTLVLAEFLLCAQVLVLWRWRSRDPLPIVFPCLALLTAVLALNRTLPMGTQFTYVFLATMALLLPALTAPVERRIAPWHPFLVPWRGRLVLLLVCGAALGGSWALAGAWSIWLPNAQSWFATQVGRGLVLYDRLPHYATTGSLTGIFAQNIRDPEAAALRVYSPVRPGYLAGRIFDHYRNGQWTVTSDTVRHRIGDSRAGLRMLQPLAAVPETIGRPASGLATFELNGSGASPTLTAMAIENDPRRGRVFFTPPGCRYVQGSGDLLAVDDHDIIRFGISVQRLYVTLVDASGMSQSLSEIRRRELLDLPPTLEPRVAALAEQVCRGARTSQEKMRAVRDFFRGSFEYSLSPVRVPRGTDPLNHFLASRHPGHCEYFASGAVILLRLQGVPARYATGYRVMERNDDEQGQWIARNRDAHAWAEAYDDRQQRWVVVEATPGFTDPTLEDSPDDEEQSAGLQSAGLALVTGSANALVRWWSGLPVPVRIALPPLVAGLLGWGIFAVLRRGRSALARAGRERLDPRVRRWQRLVQRMDRRLKRHGLVRQHAETLNQFAHRLHLLADGQEMWLRSSADWYVAYAHARFGAAYEDPPPLPPGRDRKRNRRDD